MSFTALCAGASRWSVRAGGGMHRDAKYADRLFPSFAATAEQAVRLVEAVCSRARPSLVVDFAIRRRITYPALREIRRSGSRGRLSKALISLTTLGHNNTRGALDLLCRRR